MRYLHVNSVQTELNLVLMKFSNAKFLCCIEIVADISKPRVKKAGGNLENLIFFFLGELTPVIVNFYASFTCISVCCLSDNAFFPAFCGHSFASTFALCACVRVCVCVCVLACVRACMCFACVCLSDNRMSIQLCPACKRP